MEDKARGRLFDVFVWLDRDNLRIVAVVLEI